MLDTSDVPRLILIAAFAAPRFALEHASEPIAVDDTSVPLTVHPASAPPSELLSPAQRVVVDTA
jgi:hypothetical protein